jgi:hypothetical protein
MTGRYGPLGRNLRIVVELTAKSLPGWSRKQSLHRTCTLAVPASARDTGYEKIAPNITR